jgi:high affinity Mn2+ porin
MECYRLEPPGLGFWRHALNYRPEKILETFYAFNVMKGLMLTFDYQFMLNPADNADRISFFSARLHSEF